MDHILHEFKFLAVRVLHVESLWINMFYYLLYASVYVSYREIRTAIQSVLLTLFFLLPAFQKIHKATQFIVLFRHHYHRTLCFNLWGKQILYLHFTNLMQTHRNITICALKKERNLCLSEIWIGYPLLNPGSQSRYKYNQLKKKSVRNSENRNLSNLSPHTLWSVFENI